MRFFPNFLPLDFQTFFSAKFFHFLEQIDQNGPFLHYLVFFNTSNGLFSAAFFAYNS